MRLTRTTSFALAAFLSTSPGTTTAQQRVVFTDPTLGSIVVNVDTVGDALPIPAPPAKVYAALLTVFKALDVKTEIANPSTGEVGNTNFWKMRRLAGKPLSNFFGCGRGITGPNADSYRLYISLVTRAGGAGNGGSVIRTSAQAVATNVTEGSRDRIPCQSTGLLESLIRQMTALHVQLQEDKP